MIDFDDRPWGTVAHGAGLYAFESTDHWDYSYINQRYRMGDNRDRILTRRNRRSAP